MNLVELYLQTPVADHAKIHVGGGRAYVVNVDGAVAEYVVGDDGELWAVPSPATVVAGSVAKLQSDITAIKAKLGVG